MAKNNTANTSICKNKQLFHIPRVIEREMSSKRRIERRKEKAESETRASNDLAVSVYSVSYYF
jgi:hypothetical protein